MSDENAAAASETLNQPNNDAVDPGAPDQSQQSSGADSFTEFDPSEIPEAGVSADWLKERYEQMNRDYTQKNQEIAETRRAKEEYEGIVNALREGDPQTRRSILSELGVDQQAALEAFELEMAEAEAPADQEPEFDDLDFKDPRVDNLLQEREAEKAERAEQDQQVEAEQYADEVGGKMEEDLKAAFGGKEPDEAVAEWIFSRAIEHPDQQGEPDVPGAVQAWNQVLDRQRQEWLDSRQGSPRATTPGIPGTERFDPSTKAGRDAIAEAAVAQVGAAR